MGPVGLSSGDDHSLLPLGSSLLLLRHVFSLPHLNCVPTMASTSIYESLVDMFSLFLAFLSSGTPSLARDSFYPPLNHTTYITDTSLGPYGGIYAAPADKSSPPSADDVYNYCSMPHPRPETYALPPSVANNSVSARLVYVEYMQRHQRRTPYNIFPGGEVSGPFDFCIRPVFD